MHLERDEFEIVLDPDRVAAADVIAAIVRTGYKARVVEPHARTSTDKPASLPVPAGEPPAPIAGAVAQAEREAKPVVIYFHAEWCVPCKQMAATTFADPRVRALLDRVVFVKVDTDEHPVVAQYYGVEGLPDLRFLHRGGEMLEHRVGYQSAQELTEVLQKLVEPAAPEKP